MKIIPKTPEVRVKSRKLWPHIPKTPEEQALLDALIAAEKHLDWCGYGDEYEREVAFMKPSLPRQIKKALAPYKE